MVTVSFKLAGVLLAIFVISTLLVGILPPLVNRKICDPTDGLIKTLNNDSDIDFSSNEQIADNENNFDKDSLLSKIKSTNNLKPELKKRSIQKGSYINNFYFKKYKFQKSQVYPDCPEIVRPTPGQTYPWMNDRLTSNVIPIHYDIQLFVPNFDQREFNGLMTVEIELVENSTDTFIVHSRNNAVEVFRLLDMNDEDIEISCAIEYPRNEYFVFKTYQPVHVSSSPLKIQYFFDGEIDSYESGIFQADFLINNQETSMVITQFEPLKARSVFPCFDEPFFKATFNITMDHEAYLVALSNMQNITDISISEDDELIQTVFAKTPRLPTYLIGIALFKQSEFSYVETKTNLNKSIRIWARTELIEYGYMDGPLNMAKNIVNSLLDIFQNVTEAMPDTIEILASPIYPREGIPQFGLIIFQENKVVFLEESASERDKQRVALLMAQNFAELWFGSYVTQKWWDELWLQEALGNFFKYKALQRAYPNWNIYEQFVTEELIYVLTEDAYPSSHPVIKEVQAPNQINEFFDNVVNSKASALLDMIEAEFTEEVFLNALLFYLESNGGSTGNIESVWSALGTMPNSPNWSVKDFADRWFTQSQYPMLTIRIIGCNGGKYCLDITQERALNSNSSIFADNTPYPSKFNWTWFIPIECKIGQDIENNVTFTRKFYIDKKNEIFEISPLPFGSFGANPWLYCNQKFIGYYGLKYVNSNWDHLGSILLKNFQIMEPLDRANVLHNYFFDAYSDRNEYTTYNRLAKFLNYLENENNYLPWRTVYKHINDIIDILEFKQPFEQLSRYFKKIIHQKSILKDSLWTWSGLDHSEELLKETILQLSCRLQHSECLKKVKELWDLNVQDLINDSFNNSQVAPYARRIIYNYHLQNTINFDDWFFLLENYESFRDIRLLESLTYARQPWLLRTFIEIEKDPGLVLIDFFDMVKYLSQNEIGREIIWDYIRWNYDSILFDYGEDYRLGKMLIDITNSFETEFYYYELLVFITSTPAGSSINARFRSLEKVDTNIKWLNNKQNQIITAFGE